VAKVDVVVVEETEEPERGPFLEIARKVLMAGIGAMALAQEEIEDFVNKLVERGELAEKDGKMLMREVMEKRRSETKKAEEQFDQRIEEILDRMNVPSKTDINALSAKITALTKKVDELNKA
jgi:poly(hydroxyalkanoate) granule-associated protein